MGQGWIASWPEDGTIIIDGDVPREEQYYLKAKLFLKKDVHDYVLCAA